MIWFTKKIIYFYSYLTNKQKNIMEEKEGVIIDAARRILRDDNGGGEHEFVNPAQVTIANGDGVIYIEIVTPVKVIRVIKDIKH
jgi:hypothetical protein